MSVAHYGPLYKQNLHERAAVDPEGAYRLAGYRGEWRRSGHNLLGLCPFHSDSTPSFAVTLTGEHAGTFKCFGCGAGGDIITFHQRLHHLTFGESLTRLADLFGLPSPAPVQADRHTPATPPTAPPEPDPIPEDVAAACHEALLQDRQALTWLTERKGLPEWVVHAAQIGLSRDHWRETRYTIPVPYADGREGYRDIRGYRPRPRPQVPKMLPWTRGRGATLYPWPWVSGLAEVLWCEGELDALNMIGRGLAAVTSTNGVQGALSSALVLPDLRGKHIYILGDHDPAGDRLADDLPPRLYAAGATAVTVLRWPDADPDGHPLPRGYDLSDWCAAGSTLEHAWQLVYGRQ